NTKKKVSSKQLRYIYPEMLEIAGLCYDPLTDWLWIIDSESRNIFAMSGDAEDLLVYYYMGHLDNPEAICVDHANSCIWVGDDAGNPSHLYRFDFTGLDDAIIAP
nr:hypothetical protein [Bacteroidales bacterium]